MYAEDPFKQLFGGYLHQDWDEYGTWERAVDVYALENSADVPEAIEAAEAVLRDCADDAAVKRALTAAGSAYSPTFFGQTHTEWLRAVVERLRRNAADHSTRRT